MRIPGNLDRARSVGTRWALVMVVGGLLTAPAARADDLKDGRAALAAGRYDDALRAFEHLSGQGSVEGQVGIGQVWLRRHQYAKAQDAFQKAQKMDPTVAWGFYGEAESLRRRDNCNAAVPLLQKATDLDRKFPEAQLALGECLVEQKKVDAAIAAFTQGTKWGPKWRPRFLVALGNAELARDSLRSASVYYTQAREESPQDPAPRKALGDFYLNTRRIAELAIPEYQAAVDLDTTDVELRFALAQALYTGQRYNEALDQYRRVVAADSEYAPGQLGIGNLFYLSGAADPKRYADARGPLEKYVQLAPEDSKGWSLLGRTYYSMGVAAKRDNPDEAGKFLDLAVADMDKSVKLGGTNKETFTYLGRAYSEKKDWQHSVESFEKGEPTSADLLRMAQMYAFLNQPQKADSIYSAIQAKDPTGRDAKFALNETGKAKFRSQDYDGAISAFRKVIALDPSADEAYYYIGLAHKQNKRYPDALDSLRQAANLAPDKADRQFWLGILYAQLDSTALAKERLSRSVALDSTGSFAGVAYRQLGFYELLAKNYDGAIRLLERAVGLNDKDSQAWLWLGQGYQNAGRSAKAIEAYRRVLQLDPHNAEALKGMKALGQGGAQ